MPCSKARDQFPCIISGFGAAPTYVVRLFTVVGVFVSLILIAPVINDLIHEEFLRGLFVF